MDSKGFIVLHPFMWAFFAFIIGFIIAVLIARGVIPVALPICPAAP